jgi:hypothetical protein
MDKSKITNSMDKSKFLSDIYAIYLMKILTICEITKLITQQFGIYYGNIDYVGLVKNVNSAKEITFKNFKNLEELLKNHLKDVLDNYPNIKLFCSYNVDIQRLLFEISEYDDILKFIEKEENFSDILTATSGLLNLNI